MKERAMILEDKVALITGAATGIGRETAKLFAREGAKIAIADIKDPEANQTVQMIAKAGGEAFCIHADLSRMADVEMAVNQAAERWGKLDIFFHNAGIAGPGFLDRTTEEEYDLIMDINLKAGFFGAKHAAPMLRKAGGGNILFTGSGAGIRPSPASPTYSVSKAGLIMLTRCLAYDLAKDNIRVNCICPGIVETPLWPSFMSRNPEMKPEVLEKYYIERRAIKRFGTAEEMAEAALFLVSPQASWITGVALPIDGGGAAG
jgi:NAD(P)-dependent dehydrogenase (short-subunit alcohol dehydrogenase family)